MKMFCGDGQMIHQVQFLMNDADAERLRLARARTVDRLAVEEDFAGIRLIDAGEDLHQRRLAGAVLAHQRMHFAAIEIESRAAQRMHAGKALLDAAHLHEPFARRAEIADGSPFGHAAPAPPADMLAVSEAFAKGQSAVSALIVQALNPRC